MGGSIMRRSVPCVAVCLMCSCAARPLPPRNASQPILLLDTCRRLARSEEKQLERWLDERSDCVRWAQKAFENYSFLSLFSLFSLSLSFFLARSPSRPTFSPVEACTVAMRCGDADRCCSVSRVERGRAPASHLLSHLLSLSLSVCDRRPSHLLALSQHRLEDLDVVLMHRV